MTITQALGLVGLGVMGRNLALNAADNGSSVVAYDPWAEARSHFLDNPEVERTKRITVVSSPGELAAVLPAPRTILIMVKAGEPVDVVIDNLLPLLADGDTLIDGGNSYFRDTIARQGRLAERGVSFIGLGISGGEEGARHGPSMMAGGDEAAYEACRPILESVAAVFQGQPCCARVGSDGSGHFVKMVHNGIEYAIMQSIAEAYVLMRDLAGMSHDDMAAVFREWNEGDLSSYLVEITAGILARQDDLSDGPLVEMILDKAGQKGTGRWSSEEALKLGTPTQTITEAVYARALASLKDERVEAAGVLPGPEGMPKEWPAAEAVPAVHQALLGSVVVAYAQGLALIEAGSREYGWDTDLSLVADIWRAGCVIRARLLDRIAAAYKGGASPANLMCAAEFATILADVQDGWRRTLCEATNAGVPLPGMGSALTYFDGYRSERLWANMIQAQRDCFGAHTYERIDRTGWFHTDWGL